MNSTKDCPLGLQLTCADSCVCATIAFGLGIDCPATEYVLHHSVSLKIYTTIPPSSSLGHCAQLSKSMDGYYQETGRAGRDGRDADCVLFYRGQDATRLSSLTLGEVGGQEKGESLLRVGTCAAAKLRTAQQSTRCSDTPKT